MAHSVQYIGCVWRLSHPFTALVLAADAGTSENLKDHAR